MNRKAPKVHLKMKNSESVERAYSMASYPAEGKEIMLNVRIATPPWDRNTNDWMKVNPGVASSYIFSKKNFRYRCNTHTETERLPGYPPVKQGKHPLSKRFHRFVSWHIAIRSLL